MQQNYLFEIQAPSFDGTKIGFVNDDNFAKSYGYAPRYSEYKTNYDKYPCQSAMIFRLLFLAS